MRVVFQAVLWAVLLPTLALAQVRDTTLIAGGGPSSDVGERIAVSRFGDVAVSGTFKRTATFGGVSITSADAPGLESDAFVVLYGADGAARWARRMGTGIFNDFGTGVAISDPMLTGAPAQVYVSGYFTGIATFDGGANPTVTLTTRSSFDAFLAAYSIDGDLLWVEQAGGVDEDTGRDVTVDAGGNVYWVGSFTGTSTWGQGADAETRTSAGSSDGFVARYAPDGTLDWVLAVGGPEGDAMYGVSMLADDPVGVFPLVASGTFRSVSFFGTIPLQSRGASDVVVLSMDPAAGTVAWAQQIGGNGNDYTRSVAVYPGQQIAVAGSFENTILVGSDVLTSAGFSDAFVAGLTEDGVVTAGRRAGGAGFDFAWGVATFPPGPYPVRPDLGGAFGATVVGFVDGDVTFGTTAVTARAVDGFVASFDLASGGSPSPSAVSLIGSPGGDRAYGAAYAIGPFSSFPLYVTGSMSGTATFGSASATSAGGTDVFVGSVYECFTPSCLPSAAEPGTGTAVLALAVAPNPVRASGAVTVTLAAPSDATVTVVDVRGRTVARLYRGTLAAGATRLDLPTLAPGAYWIRAATSEGVATQPLAVVR